MKWAENPGTHKQLRLETYSDAARTYIIRGHATGGPFAEAVVTNATRALSTDDFEIHGLPVSLEIKTTTGGVRRGQLFVRASLLLDGEPVQVLCAGYVTSSRYLSYPPSLVEDPLEGPGYVHLVTGTDPAAGAEVDETVPTNVRWRLISLRLTLVTDATVQNRTVHVQFTDGTTNYAYIRGPANQAASETRHYDVYEGAARETAFVGTHIMYPLPERMLLFQGHHIETDTSNLQAGDNWGAPQMLVEEWIEE